MKDNLQGKKGKRPRIVIISVNNTETPRTGGEYVYKVMKDELLKQGYSLFEVSVPILLESLMHKSKSQRKEDFYRLILHFRCVFESLMKRYLDPRVRNMVITSSHPAFPVFGHLVYHQPKTGTSIKVGREYLSLYRKIGWIIVENEMISPIWLFAKKSHILHLSNSYFTKHLVKKLYGLDSIVLYPPVPIKSDNRNFRKRRTFGVIIAKPEVPSGITLLPKIIEETKRRVRFIVFGKADQVGIHVIQALKRKGVNINYLGYISEQDKLKLFHTFSHYLHLGFNESFGITVVEAMYAGCIPIAPKSGGIPEYLPQDLLYSNLSEAAEKINAKIGMNDAELKRQLREKASQFREERFRIKFTAYIKALEELI